MIRYMGTKRHMAPQVVSSLKELHPNGRVLDLFSGMGSVAEGLVDEIPVVTNDLLTFTTAVARSRFTGVTRPSDTRATLRNLEPLYLDHMHDLCERFAEQIVLEEIAVESGRTELSHYMTTAEHVGNSRQKAKEAATAAEDRSSDRYVLTCLYFSAGYFSLRQSIQIDAIRYAIDTGAEEDERDWLISAWLVGLSALVNAPGHTAQYLKPSTDSGYLRVCRSWRRCAWTQFEKSLESLKQLGTEDWRNCNECRSSDALNLVERLDVDEVGAIYADPPYTKDQYSRFYHLYETLYRYDFPDSSGVGRVRTDLVSTGFSKKSQVAACFHDLLRNISFHRLPLVLSYPAEGLLNVTGFTVDSILSNYFKQVKKTALETHHSTLGASTGKSAKPATEILYVCHP